MHINIDDLIISLSCEYGLKILLVLLLAVAFDILFKWQAFGKIESVAIHISSFSTLYCLIEAIRGKDYYSWIKFSISLLVLFALICLHTFLKEHVHKEIEKVFLKLHKSATNALKDKILAQKTIATYAIDIALSKKKPGKRDRRHEVMDSLHEMGFDSEKQILDEDAFLLGKGRRILMMILFTILGCISVIIPIIEITKKAP